MEQLSRGARDQLYMALRFAVGDLLSADVRLPFILDDPFVGWDAHRRERMRRVLADEAERRQLLLLAHGGEYGEWGEPVEFTGEDA